MAVENGDEAPDLEPPDQDGRVADVTPKVSPKTHDEQVLKILGSM